MRPVLLPPHVVPEITSGTYIAMAAGFVSACLCFVSIYAVFVHRVLQGSKKVSFRISFFIMLVALLLQCVLYLEFGGVFFERLFSEEMEVQANGVWFALNAQIATLISLLFIRRIDLRSVAWLWSGHQLIALIVFFLVCRPF